MGRYPGGSVPYHRQKHASDRLNKVIRNLWTHGTIEYTILEKPQRRQQKCRLSDVGAIGKPSSVEGCQGTSIPTSTVVQGTTLQPESQPESLSARVLRQLVNGPMPKVDLFHNLGQKRVSIRLNKVIRNLRTHGTIEYTILEKPQRRQQKCRLSDVGAIGKPPSVEGRQGTGTPTSTVVQGTTLQPDTKPESQPEIQPESLSATGLTK